MEVKTLAAQYIAMANAMGINPISLIEEMNTLINKEHDINLKDLFSVRIVNVLANANITNLNQFKKLTELDLYKIPGLAKKSVKEIKEVLFTYNIPLKPMDSSKV